MSAARCIVAPCENFGSAARAGKCSGCAAGRPPTIDASRVTETAAVLAHTEPDGAEEVARKLSRSLEVARAYADDCPADARRLGGAVPFSAQRKVMGEELAFLVAGTVYVGSEYAAADVGLLRGLGISRIVNITSGSRIVPNYGELVAGWEVAYLHFPLDDRQGVPVRDVLAAMHTSATSMREWEAAGRRVFVHCSAGLCRSPTMVLAWLMASRGLSLGAAMELFTTSRGRPPALSTSYSTALVKFERELAAAAGGSGGAVPPTFDFTDTVCADLSVEGGATSLQLAPASDIARLYRELDYDGEALLQALLG